jgi:hypothetical protein
MSGGTRNTDTSVKVTGCVNWSLLRATSIGSVKLRHGRNAQRYGSKTRPLQRNVTLFKKFTLYLHKLQPVGTYVYVLNVKHLLGK